MTVRQVRTKNNAYTTVKYDSAGNILTPSRRRELRKLTKKYAKGPKWVKIVSKFNGKCCNCNDKILVGTEILWNKKTKNTKHALCV